MKIKITLLFSFLFLLTACASAYKPSANVIQLRSSMSKAQAAAVIKSLIVQPERATGLCKGHGVEHAGMTNNKWSINYKTPELKISDSGFSFNALQHFDSYTTSGNIATQGAAGLTTSVSTRVAPFRKQIQFADISNVKLYPDTGTMTRRCYRPEGHTEVVVNQAKGFAYWFVLMLKNEDVERFIAAIMVLSPKAAIKVG